MGIGPPALPPPATAPPLVDAPEVPPPPQQPPEGEEEPPWTPEQIMAFLQTVAPGVKYLGDLWWKNQQETTKRDAVRRQHGFHTILVLMGFLGGLVLLMAYLTIRGYVSGDALLFLAGAVASWILFAVGRHLFESSENLQRPLL
jgi:hypothetical protein